MSKRKSIIAGITSLAIVVATCVASPSYAFNRTVQDGANSARGNDQTAQLFGDGGIFNTITNTLLYVLGAIAVIMIVIGGLRYVISGGDSSQVTAAKNTILYAVVGLIVAILAYAIINFVIGSFAGGGAGAGGTNV